MKNLFTMKELMTHDPCNDGLKRLTEGLGVYSGPTIITTDDLELLKTSDILGCVKLLPISEHAQRVLCVKTALDAANSVAHLTDDPNAAKCREATRAWLDNPCDETRKAARTAAAYYAAAAAYYAADATAYYVAVAVAVATYYAAAYYAARTTTAAAAAAVRTASTYDDVVIKAHLIKLIKELDE